MMSDQLNPFYWRRPRRTRPRSPLSPTA